MVPLECRCLRPCGGVGSGIGSAQLAKKLRPGARGLKQFKAEVDAGIK